MSDGSAAPDMGQMLATIEREAARRGLVLELRGVIVTDHEGHEAPEGDRFCSVARAAWAATDGQSDLSRQFHAHVAQLIGAVGRSARDRSGPVRVARTSWVLLKSYAATGAPPRRDDDVDAPRMGRAAGPASSAPVKAREGRPGSPLGSNDAPRESER